MQSPMQSGCLLSPMLAGGMVNETAHPELVERKVELSMPDSIEPVYSWLITPRKSGNPVF